MGTVDIHSLGYYDITKSIMFSDKRENTKIPLPPYKVPNLHPHNYYKTSQPKHFEDPVSNAKSSKQAETDPYPWLDSDDLRRGMTDEEILDKYFDLSSSGLNAEEKNTLLNIIKSHKEAFSLGDEIGKCPNIKIDIDFVDDSPFLARPFPIHEEDKPLWISIWLS